MSTTFRQGYYIFNIPDEAAYFIAFMAQAFVESSSHDDLGYLNLFIMSEMDWFRGRSPRWFSAPTYAGYKGYEAPPTTADKMSNYSGMTGLFVMNMLFHEVCHNFKGHTVDGLKQVAALRRQGQNAEAAALLIENEADADRCAAELALKTGSPPGLTMAATLAIPIVMGDAPTMTHPLSRDRIVQAQLYDERALSTAADRGLFPQEHVGKAHAVTSELLRVLEDYHRRYN